MARAKSTKNTKKSKSKQITQKAKTSNVKSKVASLSNQKFYSQLKLNESYVSLILGAVVVLGLFALFFVFIKESKNSTTPQEVLNESISPVLSRMPMQTYILQENETLWDVAVKFYGDGFRYTEIVEANKDVITNPDYVPPGTKIIIPNLK